MLIFLKEKDLIARRSFLNALVKMGLVLMIIEWLVTTLGFFFHNNFAWLCLTKANANSLQNNYALDSLEYFRKVGNEGNLGQHVSWGMGLAYSLLGETERALEVWRESDLDPHMLVSIGNSFRSREKLNEALSYYRGVINLDRDDAEIQFLAGNICQLVLFDIDKASRSNWGFCNNYFVKNDRNLIINSQFAQANIVGWEKHHNAGARYEIDMKTGKSSPSVMIKGYTGKYHGGIFQSLILASGNVVRYSMWLKIQPEGGIKVYPLYFRARQNGQLIVGAGKPLVSDKGWTYLERNFRVPEVDGSHFGFYPVFFKGQGTVWVDDVRLEIQKPE
jgi:hypothetical protein